KGKAIPIPLQDPTDLATFDAATGPQADSSTATPLLVIQAVPAYPPVQLVSPVKPFVARGRIDTASSSSTSAAPATSRSARSRSVSAVSAIPAASLIKPPSLSSELKSSSRRRRRIILIVLLLAAVIAVVAIVVITVALSIRAHSTASATIETSSITATATSVSTMTQTGPLPFPLTTLSNSSSTLESSTASSSASDDLPTTTTTSAGTTSTVPSSTTSAGAAASVSIPVSKTVSNTSILLYFSDQATTYPTSSVFWNDYSGTEKFEFTQKPGALGGFNTYQGHIWVARAGNEDASARAANDPTPAGTAAAATATAAQQQEQQMASAFAVQDHGVGGDSATSPTIAGGPASSNRDSLPSYHALYTSTPVLNSHKKPKVIPLPLQDVAVHPSASIAIAPPGNDSGGLTPDAAPEPLLVTQAVPVYLPATVTTAKPFFARPRAFSATSSTSVVPATSRSTHSTSAYSTDLAATIASSSPSALYPKLPLHLESKEESSRRRRRRRCRYIAVLLAAAAAIAVAVIVIAVALAVRTTDAVATSTAATSSAPSWNPLSETQIGVSSSASPGTTLGAPSSSTDGKLSTEAPGDATATSSDASSTASTLTSSAGAAASVSIPASKTVSNTSILLYFSDQATKYPTSSVFWNDYSGTEKFEFTQKPGALGGFTTYQGHIWVARAGDDDASGMLLGYYSVGAEPTQTWTYN
ncbi:hypothetical protein HK405_011312, partial [Cladochytrium tenue]